MSDKSRNEMSRRNLLGGIGVGAGVIGMTGLSSAKAAVLPAPGTSENFDVVVIGTGLSGCAAALEAVSRGAKVAVLDKVPENRAGGNSALAAGTFAIPTDKTEAAARGYIEDFEKLCLGRGNSEIFGLMARNVADDMEWLRANGITFQPATPHATYRVLQPVASPGMFMGMPRQLRNLRTRISDKGGTFFFETKARQLLLNDRGAVSGVRAVGPKGVVDYVGKSVVIAAGGYAANTQMLEAYADPGAGGLMVRGVDWATGDGLRMAEQAGAGLRGLGGIMALHIAGVDKVETAAGNPSRLIPFGISVNGNGERFVDESLGYVAHGKAIVKQSGQAASLIFDETIRSQNSPKLAIDLFRRLGVKIHEANTLAELAGAIGVPQERFIKTIQDFNNAIEGTAAAKATPPKAALAYKIENPKFYALSPLVPGITLTFGGIMINARAQVLEADRRVIPGLFAAGEGAGAVFFDDYVGGGSLTNCLVMGRIAGREAIA